MEFNLKKLVILSGAFLLCSGTLVKSEGITSNRTDTVQKKISVDSSPKTDALSGLADVKLENMSAEATMNNENEFEAVLFDYQSQETFGQLNWEEV